MTSTSNPVKTIRYVPFAPYSPYENMAIDEAMISWYEKTKIPVFRLYAWNPAGISIGKNQDALSDIDIDKCVRDTVPVVRRLTGGGAIYHHNEVTYSLVCSDKNISAEALTVKGSFEKLNFFIIAMYAKFGLEACYARNAFSDTGKFGTRDGFCFAGREEYDIVIQGRKIGGNAQFRRKDLDISARVNPFGCKQGDCPVF